MIHKALTHQQALDHRTKWQCKVVIKVDYTKGKEIGWNVGKILLLMQNWHDIRHGIMQKKSYHDILAFQYLVLAILK